MSDEEYVKRVFEIFEEASLQEFEPSVWYNSAGDLLEVMFKNHEYTGKYINPNLTVYISDDTGEMIGCAITFAQYLIDKTIKKAKEEETDNPNQTGSVTEP